MPFTIHHDQKPSDNERYWQDYIDAVNTQNRAAANECMMHIENLRMARIFEKSGK